MNSIQLTEEYHKIMGIIVKDSPDISSVPLNKFRVKLLANELWRVSYALEREDLISAAQHLAQLQIELDSTLLCLGLASRKDALVQEVHNSNMTKLNDEGKPVITHDGKIGDTSNYIEPILTTILRK